MDASCRGLTLFDTVWTFWAPARGAHCRALFEALGPKCQMTLAAGPAKSKTGMWLLRSGWPPLLTVPKLDVYERGVVHKPHAGRFINCALRDFVSKGLFLNFKGLLSGNPRKKGHL